MNAVKLKLRVDPTTGPALRSFALKTARVLQGEKVEFTAEDIAIQAWLLEQARAIEEATCSTLSSL